jgi:hypothetical protein
MTASSASEAVAWRYRIGSQNLWSYCDTESDADFYIKRSAGQVVVKEPLYASSEIERLRAENESLLKERAEAVSIAIEATAREDALKARLAVMDAALEGSTAMKCSTGENYSVAVYFVDLARAQEFHGFIAERCADLRRAREARVTEEKG